MIGYANRFDRAEGSKSFRPLTLWRAADGTLKWVWVGLPDPRPLFGLDRLAARPDAPVIVCEGEKAADAATQLAPDRVGITSPNGSKSAGKADWSPLRGRHVVLWPDADAPGEAYATEAAGLIWAAGAASVSRLTPPNGVAEGWDAADALAEGWGLERTAAFLAIAQAVARPATATATAQAAEPAAKAAPARPSPLDDDGDGDGKRGRGRPSWHDILTEITSDFTLWHSPRKIAFASITMPDGHRENMALRSEAFLRLLRLRAHEKTERPAPKSNLEDMIALLEAQAIAHGAEQEEWLRVGRRDGNLYVDLGCRQWRAVEITPSGVRILTSHALPFVRSEGMLALPEPEFGSERGIDELRDFVNAESDGDFKLIAAWTLYALCGSKEYPLLVLNGEQGTGKSTLTRTLASLVDPHELDIMAPPEEVEDLFVIAKHAHLLPIDNLSKLDGTMSDALCRIATGGTSAVRTLFSNAGLTLLKAARPVLLNGIPSLTDRPDLAQRTVTVRLRPIPEEERKVADDMAARWQEVRPRVLGTLFEAISRGLRDAPTIRLERLPRMAGFARFVAACAPGLGFDRDELLAAYAANQAELADSAFENNPVATAIAAMMERVGDAWEGTPTELYEALCAPDVTSERVRASFAWPKSAQSLSTAITRVAPALRARGIDTERKHSGKTYWLIRKL